MAQITERVNQSLSSGRVERKADGLRLISENLIDLIYVGVGPEMASMVRELLLCVPSMFGVAQRVFIRLALCIEGFQLQARSFLEGWRALPEDERHPLSYTAAFVSVFGGLELSELEWLSELLEQQAEPEADLRALVLIHARLCEEGSSEGARRVLNGLILTNENVEAAGVLAELVCESLHRADEEEFRTEFLRRLPTNVNLPVSCRRLVAGERPTLMLNLPGWHRGGEVPFLVKGASRVVQVGAARAAAGGDGAFGGMLTGLHWLQKSLLLPLDDWLDREDLKLTGSRKLKAAFAGEESRRSAKVRHGPRWARSRDPSRPWVRPQRHRSPGCTYCQPWLVTVPYQAKCIREEIDGGLWEHAYPDSSEYD